MTQTDLVRKVLRESGSISKLEGMHYNVGDVGRECRRLRASGMDIETVTMYDQRDNRYTRYVYTA